MGNGTETAGLECPYCGEPVEVVVDTSVPLQEYTEDCPVCCRPMVLTVEIADAPRVTARREED
ncbi:MAG TPA: CPXCG motif-containing cysteine-rich protein [Gammaproteobacteria bacterium]|nr:CPXCG motif-containing cysteine-rich protein [Gammaproteobacteria bacterium]